jgi:hypothetical protein
VKKAKTIIMFETNLIEGLIMNNVLEPVNISGTVFHHIALPANLNIGTSKVS